jgi:hypothetical protein
LPLNGIISVNLSPTIAHILGSDTIRSAHNFFFKKTQRTFAFHFIEKKGFLLLRSQLGSTSLSLDSISLVGQDWAWFRPGQAGYAWDWDGLAINRTYRVN